MRGVQVFTILVLVSWGSISLKKRWVSDYFSMRLDHSPGEYSQAGIKPPPYKYGVCVCVCEGGCALDSHWFAWDVIEFALDLHWISVRRFRAPFPCAGPALNRFSDRRPRGSKSQPAALPPRRGQRRRVSPKSQPAALLWSVSAASMLCRRILPHSRLKKLA